MTATQPVTVAVGEHDLPTESSPGTPPGSPQSNSDLVVVSPAVSDSRPAAGAAFTLSATVRNDGAGDAAATTLRYSDLEVAFPEVSDSSPVERGRFTLWVTVGNFGDAESAATTLRYYQSTDATISSADTQVGTGAVEAVEAHRISQESIDVTAPATAGRGPADETGCFRCPTPGSCSATRGVGCRDGADRVVEASRRREKRGEQGRG